MPSQPEPPSITASLPFQFVFWLAVVLVMKWPTLSEPPVWDAAFGLFPAAGELADTGFDLPALLRQPTFVEGGPNCHAESLVTLVTACVLRIVGKGPAAIALLHLLHFAVTAWTLAVLHRFASDGVGRPAAWLVCGTVLLCPLFRVQAGAMYFEMPLAACTISALDAFARGRLGRAMIWATLAVLVKQAGLVVVGALIAAVLLGRGSWSKRLTLSLGFGLPAVAAVVWPLIGTPVLHSVASRAEFESWWSYMQRYHLPYLKAIPDIASATGLLALVVLLKPRDLWRSWRSVGVKNLSENFSPLAAAGEGPGVRGQEPGGVPTDGPLTPALSREGRGSQSIGSEPVLPGETGSTTQSSGAVRPFDSPAATVSVTTVGSTLHLGLAWLLVPAFAGFFFLVPYVARVDVYCLPRYFVFVLPVVVFGWFDVVARLASRPVAGIALGLACAWFVANRDGAFYPPARGNNLAVIERSEDYRHLVSAQRAVASAAANLRDDSLLLYGLPEHYFLARPWLGYAHRTPRNGRCVTLRNERPESMKVADLPDRFHVLLDATILGGRDLRAVLREAEADPSRRIRTVEEAVRGPYRVSLYEVSRMKADEP